MRFLIAILILSFVLSGCVNSESKFQNEVNLFSESFFEAILFEENIELMFANMEELKTFDSIMGINRGEDYQFIKESREEEIVEFSKKLNLSKKELIELGFNMTDYSINETKFLELESIGVKKNKVALFSIEIKLECVGKQYRVLVPNVIYIRNNLRLIGDDFEILSP